MTEVVKRFKQVSSALTSKGEQELIFKFGEDRFHSLRLPIRAEPNRVAYELLALARRIQADEELKYETRSKV